VNTARHTASGSLVHPLREKNTPQQPAAPQDENDEIDLGALLATIWRGKWIVAALCVVAVLVGGVYAYGVATPLYTAKATVILEAQEKSVAGLESVVAGLSTDTSEVNSELEVLRARGLMGKVVDRLDLVSDPEFNIALQEPGPVSRIKALLISFLPGGAPPPPLGQSRERDAVVSKLLEKMTVANVRNSLVFDITLETEDPEKSALIADTVAELYILDQIEVKFDKTEQATSWLSDRVAELQIDLENAEGKVAEFTASTALVSVEALRALERQLKDTRDRITPLVESSAGLEARLAALGAAETRAERTDLADDPQLARIWQQVQAGEGGEAAFDARFARILAQAEVEVARNAQQIQSLQEAAQSLSQRIEAQGQDLIRLQQLTREAEATRLLYEHFLTRLKETSAQQGIQQADSRILSNAVVPINASFPRKSLVLALSAILGIMFGIALVLLREMRNNSFRTAEDLERSTGLTVVGQIPIMPAHARSDVLAYMRDKPTSAAVEAVRNLRTSVLLSDVDNPPQVIVSTSSVPGEGKTTVALALAQNLIGMGKKVLLIEGDIRRRTLNEYFKDVPKHGIVSILSGEKTFDEVVFRPAEFDGEILPGDNSKVNAADLFSSDKFRAFIAELRHRYDMIIIDTPPVLVVPDARIIAQSADALLFAVKWNSTSRSQVTEALRLLQTSNIRPTGFVLSQISPNGMKKYGYGGKYGAYGAYGSKYYTN
jgi:capsular exopolysaccharide synthesis family protein